MRKMIVAAVLMLSVAVTLAAAGPEDEVRAAEKSWTAAVAALDYTALDKLLHDQLIYAHSTGVVESKAEYLAKLKSGTQKYDSIEHLSLTVKPHGNAAVAHAIVRMQGKTKGEPFDNRLMMLHLWVKNGGKWQLAAHQTTRLTNP
jgi:ketosteroid isomerase-like protein